MLKESGSDAQLGTKLLIDRIGLERLAQVIRKNPGRPGSNHGHGANEYGGTA
jgi:hypothetical protein